jgi:hypothetical protein
MKPERKVERGQVIEIYEQFAVVVEDHPVYEFLYDYISSEP